MLLTHSQIFQRAWPIILANAAVPTLGLADTFIIGNTGNTQDIGAIALGALIFNLVYWSFGFLRMGTTGFTAQAAGAKQWQEVRLVLGRALLIAISIAAILLLVHKAIDFVVFLVFQASSAVENQASHYFTTRIWGAPATLCTFALLGTLVGLGKSAQLLSIQLFLNGLNIGLDFFFAGYLGWGVKGIAIGTCIAEYCTLIFATAVVYQVVKENQVDGERFWTLPQLIDKTAIVKMLSANGDILVRTVLLVLSFAWFTNAGAVFGDTILAANHILLQFLTFTGFFLDGYAFVAESIVGTALGAKQVQLFKVGIRRSTDLGMLTAFLLGVSIFISGDFFIAILTDIVPVQTIAKQFLWLVCVYVILSFPAYQFDAIFIGAVKSAEMRNAAIVSTVIFVGISYPLMQYFGNDGLWWAFIIYVIVRALCLWWYFPRITRAFNV